MKSKKIGIYKIESPSKKIYIGQSKNIEHRFKQYYRLTSIEKQRRLYNSFLKYGVINHKFTIIEECDESNLNVRERYWQEYYEVVGKYGLNCKYVEVEGKSCEVSMQTKKLMSKNSASSKEVICLITKQIWSSAKDCAKDNNIKHNILINKLNNIVINDTYFLYLEDIPMKGINYGCELITSKDKKVININNHIIYNSLKECCIKNNLNYQTFKSKLNGHKKNNTEYRYLEKEHYLYIKYCKLLKEVLFENLYSPFSIHDSEYIKELNNRIESLKEKLKK